MPYFEELEEKSIDLAKGIKSIFKNMHIKKTTRNLECMTYSFEPFDYNGATILYVSVCDDRVMIKAETDKEINFIVFSDEPLKETIERFLNV